MTERVIGHIEEREAVSAAADVDVIILSWNRVEDTIAAIGSACEQRGVSQRIFVVDQGSEPANLALLDEYVKDKPLVTMHKLTANSGVAGGRNIASGLGTAPIIVALDSDAIFADALVLSRVVAHMKSNLQLCAIGFRITNFFNRSNDDTSWDYGSERSADHQFESTRFIGAGHAIRRSTFEAVGGYDARLFFCGEERDLCYRMLNTGLRIQYVPTIEIYHKVSPEHRVFWGAGRFYYTVRNTLYFLYKYHAPLPRILVAAAGFLIKGFANGLVRQSLRGIFASVGLCRQYRRDPADQQYYRLSHPTLTYIRSCEPERNYTWLTRLRRHFVPLPHQGTQLRTSR